MATDQDPGAERLLRSREARGLLWAIYARLAYVSIGIVGVPLTSPSVLDVVLTEVLLVSGVALNLYFRRLVRAERRLSFAGLAGAVFDVVVLGVMPLSWYASVGGRAVSPVFLLKSDVLYVAVVLIAINTLALRPAYPALIAAMMIVQQTAFLCYAAADGRINWTLDPVVNSLHGGFHPMFWGWRQISMLLCGATGALIAWTARRTIRDRVALELHNLRMREQQAELISEGKINALAQLVAGISHEINTPLAALSSEATLASSAAVRVERAVADAMSIEMLRSDTRLSRALKMLGESETRVEEAMVRIQSLLRSLSSFAHLDHSDHAPFDVRRAIDDALVIISGAQRGNVRVLREFPDQPLSVVGHVAQLNQVLMTLILNAFDAMSGEGTLTLKAQQEDSRVVVEITDTGPGIPSEQLKQLFEIGMGQKRDRVGLRLGLPISKTIVLRHGGTIDVESRPGEGTTFRVTLPAA